MKTAFLSLLWGAVGYAVGLSGTIVLLPLLTRNTHDAALEAAMTGAFFFGPLVGLAGALPEN
jgi:hypothetical protein